MPTLQEYALLSNSVYNRTEKNRTVVLPSTEWTAERPWIQDLANGFSAGVYKKGSDIVIAYTGTNEKWFADFALANIPAFTGLPSPQVWEAMKLYLQVVHDNPSANITFTGHSLGGGLASMMGIFFDRQAQVFDAAPFKVGAVSPVALAEYQIRMATNGFSNAAFESYITSIASQYFAREANVIGDYLQGDVLAGIRGSLTAIGHHYMVQTGPTTAAAQDLHSMTLLASMERSTEFADAVRKSPALLALVFDKDLYSRDPETSDEPNFIDRLYIAQVSNSTTPLLDRFGTDVKQLTVAGGTTAQQDMQKALDVAALDYYYYKDPANATGLFTTNSGAVNFNLADVGVAVSSLKGPEKLRDALAQVAEDDGNAVKLAAGSIASWHVQSGAGAMTWTGSNDLAEVAIGGTAGDILNGGDGNDVLVGLGGADSLAGGVGNDTLVGGAGDYKDTMNGGDGADLYVVGKGAGTDTITSSETADRLSLNRRELNGNGTLMSDAADFKLWQDRSDPAYAVTYRFDVPTKRLTIVSAGSTVVIEDFADGDVGIFIPQAAKKSASGSRGQDAEVDAGTNTHWRTALPAPVRRDPLAIDLDGNGINTVGITATPILFDHNADGIRIGTGWVKANDAWLVFDRDGNGSIDSGRELFGVDTLLSGTPGVDAVYATSGFQALAALNTNGDGVFSALDSTFGQVRVWQDLNQDGVSQSTELFTLAQKSIASIGLFPTSSTVNLGNGNTVTAKATVTRVNGTTTQVDSVAVSNDRTASNLTLANNPFYRTFTNSIALTAEARALPDMQGSGVIRDLREAMSLGNAPAASLVAAVRAFGVSVNREAQLGMLDAVLRSWAGTESMVNQFNIEPLGQETRRFVVPGSTDSTLQTRLNQIIPVLEVFNGRTVDESGWASTISSVNGVAVRTYSIALQQAASMQASYESLRNSVYEPLALQTRLKPYREGIVLVTDAAGTRFDTTRLGQALDEKKSTNERNGVLDLVELLRLTGNTLWAAGYDPITKLNSWVAALPAASPLRTELASLGVYTGTGTGNKAGSEIFLGTSASEYLGGGGGDDTLRGGAGNDTLSGETGHDMYIFGKGDAADTIDNASYESQVGKFDVLQFSAGVAPTEVIARRVDNKLVLGIAGTADTITVLNFFSNNAAEASNPIQQFRFGDGTTWDIGAMMAKVIVGDSTAQALTGYDTDDNINGAGGKDSVNGAAGADTIQGGDGDDKLTGGLGNDVLDGGPGNDTVQGDEGNNTIVFGKGDGQDQVYRGSATATGGFNVLQFKAGVAQSEVSVLRDLNALVISIKGTTDKLTIASFFDGDDTTSAKNPIQEIRFADGSILNFPTLKAMAIAGDETAQSLRGYVTADSINAAGGDDTVYGRAGNDSVDGGAGLDDLSGDDGNDSLNGGGGADRVFGNAGNDTVLGGSDNDLVEGVAGDDVLDGGLGNDTVNGGAGNDIYFFGRGEGQDHFEYDTSAQPSEKNILLFKDGVTPEDVVIRYSNPSFQVYTSDFCEYSRATLEVAIKSTADFVVIGGYSIDSGQFARIQEIKFSDGTTWDDANIKAKSIFGNDARQVLAGYSTNDLITAKGGDDTLYGATGADTLDGGAGKDLVEGGDGDDWLIGGSDRDLLLGTSGTDILDGGEGDDTLYGGVGDDIYLFGKGDGADTVFFDFGVSDTPVGENNLLLLKAGVTQSEITVSRKADELRLGIIGTVDTIRIPNFFYTNDPINTKNPIQKIQFNDGSVLDFATIKQKSITSDETAQYMRGFSAASALNGAGGNDTLVGNTGSDTLDGGDGNDSIYGSDGDDTLIGGSGADLLLGESGADTYLGGAGPDTLSDSSTASNDIYVWGRGEGIDTLSDSGGTDRLDILAGVTEDQIWLRKVGNNLELSVIGTSDSLTINGWYTSTANQVESFKLADGQALLASQVQQLVDAMASFAPPAAGQTTLPANYQTALNPVIAPSWA